VVSLFPVSVVRASELVGRVVGGRYRLLRAIGSGASAHVYVAEDVRLRRRTALKVLQPALAGDRSFLRRFQAEAQTVAVLRHPGIVRVYDWGEDSDEAYLVMELLEGGSLRALLDTGYRLSVSQAAAVGLDIAAALAYAHSRGLVHRDIKPANLLFDEEGHSSVADFGIARALAEASWTEPVGALVGTARYASPEQLTGQPLDARADVYSLALVLIEAVTGQVPFAMDTTLAALIARSTTPLAVSPELEALRPVIERAGALKPEDRITAEQMGEEIATIARRLRAPGPLPLSGLRLPHDPHAGPPTELPPEFKKPPRAGLSILAGDLEVVAEAGQDATASVDGASADVLFTPPLSPPEISSFPLRPLTSARVPEQRSRSSEPPVAARAVPAPKRRRRWRTVLMVPTVIVLCAGGAGAYVYFNRPPPPPPTYPVPDLRGERVAPASESLAKEHLLLSVTSRVWSATTDQGAITSQYPVPGSRLLAQKAVDVTVSLGPEPVAVPSLVTLDVAQARAFLTAAGLRLGTLARQTSMTVPAGLIISWSHRGQRLLPGRAVNVVVSAGKPVATVPSAAVGMPFSQLAAELHTLGLVAQPERFYNDNVRPGLVISTNPPPGSQEVVGTVVVVNVSLGQHLVTIPPSIVGFSVEQAAKALSELGLYVSRVSGSPLAPVASTEPGVGTAVLYGSSIVLVTS